MIRDKLTYGKYGICKFKNIRTRMVRGLKYLTKKAFILLSTLCVHCTCMYACISPSLVASLELVGNITINGFQKINLLSSLFLPSFLVHNNDDNK